MGTQKKVGKKLFAVAWKNRRKRILILKKSLVIGKVIGLWAKSFKRNCDLSWEHFGVLQNLFSMDWKRRFKNFWSVKEYLEPHFKTKCLSNCLSGLNWTEERQDRFKEFYKIGWMAFQRIPLNPFPLIVGKRSQIGVIVLFFCGSGLSWARWLEGTFKWILEEIWLAKINGLYRDGSKKFIYYSK